jgi:hypothetical protein
VSLLDFVLYEAWLSCLNINLFPSTPNKHHIAVINTINNHLSRPSQPRFNTIQGNHLHQAIIKDSDHNSTNHGHYLIQASIPYNSGHGFLTSVGKTFSPTAGATAKAKAKARQPTVSGWLALIDHRQSTGMISNIIND